MMFVVRFSWRVFLMSAMCVVLPAAQAQESPLHAEVAFTGDQVRNLGGGAARGSQWLSTTDLALSLNTDEAGWWKGGQWFAEVLLDQGRDPSARFIGDAQTASNIADRNRTNLHQFWYEQALGGHVSLLAGLHDLNSEFDVSEYAALFLNSSFGIGPDVSANTSVSLWPRAGGGARLHAHAGRWHAAVAVYDGDPATRAIRPGAEGLMYIAEAGWVDGARAFKLGAWRHTGDKTAPDGRLFGGNEGMYLVTDQPLAAWDGGGLGAFLQLGFARRDRNEIGDYLGFGLHVDGPFPGRAGDSFGIALARAGFSAVNRRANGLTRAEIVIETDYDAALTDWLHLHPAFQYIMHPGGDPALRAAKVVMLRVEASLP